MPNDLRQLCLPETRSARGQTEYVARNAAGYIDMAAAVVLPLAYLVLVLVLLGGGSEGAWGRAGFDGTEIRHLHDGAWTRWAR